MVLAPYNRVIIQKKKELEPLIIYKLKTSLYKREINETGNNSKPNLSTSLVFISKEKY